MDKFNVDVLKSYYELYSLGGIKYNSFNRLIKQIPQIIKKNFPLIKHCPDKSKHVIHLEDLKMYKPVIHESDGTINILDIKQALLRQETYASEVYIDVRYEIYDDNNKLIHQSYSKNNLYAKIPIPTLSDLCNLKDYPEFLMEECKMSLGGVYIIEGMEKLLVACERGKTNEITYNKCKNKPYTYYTEYRSTCYKQYDGSKNVIVYVNRPSKHNKLMLHANDAPWILYMRAYGITEAETIYKLVRAVAKNRWCEKYEEIFYNTFENDEGIITQHESIEQIGKLQPYSSLLKNSDEKDYFKNGELYLEHKMFSNAADLKLTNMAKIFLLIEMACGSIDLIINPQKINNRDSHFNKEIEDNDELVGIKIREYQGKKIEQIMFILSKRLKGVDDRIENFNELFSKDNIFRGLKDNISTGTWHADKHKGKITRTGISQKFERANYISMIAQYTKVINPLPKHIKRIPPRLIHPTSYGTICPADSPEGESCGLAKHFALLTHVSSGTLGMSIMQIIKPHLIPLNEIKNELYLVHLNGVPIGLTHDSQFIYDMVVNARRSLRTSLDTSCSFDKQHNVYIRTNRGRTMKAYYVVENLYKLDKIKNSKQLFNVLLANGIVEYIDKLEEKYIYLADKIEKVKQDNYTHMAISGVDIYGVVVSAIAPFPDHNQSARNTLLSAMARQAQGECSTTSITNRMDRNATELWYPQKPIVSNFMHDVFKCDKLPSGQNIFIAITSDGDKKQDDANGTSKAAADLGMERSTIRRCTTIGEKKMDRTPLQMTQTPITLPNEEVLLKIREDESIGVKNANFDHIEQDGIIAVSAPVESNTIIAQKVSHLRQPLHTLNYKTGLEQHINYVDHSVVNVSTNNEKGYVDKVTVTSTADGRRTAKIKVQFTANIKNGDKFAPRCGQKGITAVTPTEDLIYTEDGMIPHMIISTLAFGGRMTWSMMLEALYGIVCAMNGHYGDASPFSKLYRESLYKNMEEYKKNFIDEQDVLKEIQNALLHLGMSPSGEHVFYSGKTGKKLKETICMGIVNQQRLKHMVIDKVRARAGGKIQALNRQATEKRSEDGGIKFAAMETNCLITHGASANINDRLCKSADPCYLPICQNCGNIGIERESMVYCQCCSTGEHVRKVESTNTSKLFIQELRSSNVTVNFDLEGGCAP